MVQGTVLLLLVPTPPYLKLETPIFPTEQIHPLRLTNSVGQATSQTLTLQQAIGAPGLPLEEANATEVPRSGLILWMDANDLDADGKADNLPVDTLVTSWLCKVGDINATQATFLKTAQDSELALFGTNMRFFRRLRFVVRQRYELFQPSKSLLFIEAEVSTGNRTQFT